MSREKDHGGLIVTNNQIWIPNFRSCLLRLPGYKLFLSLRLIGSGLHFRHMIGTPFTDDFEFVLWQGPECKTSMLTTTPTAPTSHGCSVVMGTGCMIGINVYLCTLDAWILPFRWFKPLSQLAHDHFKTFCDPAFWLSYDGSPTLHQLSLPLHAIFRSPAVASDF